MIRGKEEARLGQPMAQVGAGGQEWDACKAARHLGYTAECATARAGTGGTGRAVWRAGRRQRPSGREVAAVFLTTALAPRAAESAGVLRRAPQQQPSPSGQEVPAADRASGQRSHAVAPAGALAPRNAARLTQVTRVRHGRAMVCTQFQAGTGQNPPAPRVRENRVRPPMVSSFHRFGQQSLRPFVVGKF